jgi:hypothetical protein
MLQHEFAGYGDLSLTKVVISYWNEFMIRDLRYGTERHGFVLAGGMDPEEFRLKECRRSAFLRDKLIEDLKIAEKIFVYHNRMDRLSDETIDAIYTGVRKFGKSKILIVSSLLSNSEGDVQEIGDGLFLGYIRKFGNIGNGWNIQFDEWRTIIARTAALSRAE